MTPRHALALALLLAACTGPAGAPGDVGTPGVRGEDAPSLTLTPPALELDPGGAATVTARVAPAAEAVAWATTNAAVATVDAQGVVTATGPGTTFVTAATASGRATAFAAVLVRGARRHAEVSWARDVEPLFREAGVWYPGAPSCDSCHFSGNDNSAAELELASYSGLLAGSYAFSTPANARSVLGEGAPGRRDFDWNRSILRRRLREHRMPPLGPFSIQGTGRDGPLVPVGGDAGAVRAVDLLGAWVAAGAPRSGPFAVGAGLRATFEGDVLPLFTREGVWYPGAPSCGFCHFQSTPRGSAELRMRDYDGIMRGARSRSEAPGVSILGESAPGRGDFNWDASILRQRLRDERMPPGMPYDRNGAWADGPLRVHPVTGAPVRAVDLIGEWVRDGARNN